MISRFFIDRPIFAAVLSIVITLTGAIALFYLPVAQYPRVTPPGVSVSISYPGASAEVVAATVAAPIEQQVNGVEGMLYMSSQSGNDGSYTLAVTFDIGTDLDTALVMVQNRVALAMPQLPSSVQNQGISIRKKTPDMLMIVNLFSPDARYDDIYLSNYATIHLKDELLRVEGVSDINLQGQRDYSIRVWLDPQKLASRSMTAMDVARAIRSQNLEGPAGRIGQPPIGNGQPFDLPIDTLGRLSTLEQFGDIIVKTGGRPAALSPTGIPVQSVQGAASTSAPSGGLIAPPLSVSSTDSSASSTDSSSTSATTASSGTSTSSGSSSATGGSTSAPAGGADTGGGGGTGGGGSIGGGVTAGNTLAGLGLTSTGIEVGGASIGASAGGTVGATALSGGALDGGPPSPASSLVRLRDVARLELGAQNYNLACTYDGHMSVGLGIFQLPGTNALDVADRVRAKMEDLKSRFPDGVEYEIGYDTTPFIRDSVADVVRTLLEAVLLVGAVVLLFLQSWRAVLIPLTAVPVAIVGTFAVMAILGFSLNNISLFGLVLAIGIVVDDAIVVVENVERWLEHGLPPREATRRAMDEVTGPIVAVALVLCAVFVPCAFIGGITGRFFRQFAVTITVSTVFSAFNSLTLSPALAAILLKPRGGRRDPLTWLLDTLLGWFFRLFNRAFGAGIAGYAWVVGRLMRVHVAVLLAYGALLAVTFWVFQSAPTGFIPQQDQGRLLVNIQLAPATSLGRTRAAVAQIDRIARQTPGVAHTVTISGLSFILQANSPNFASMFIVLDPFDKRQAADLRDTAIMARLRKAWSTQVKDAQATVFGAAPVPGIGVAGGFKLVVEDRGGLGVQSLQRQTDDLIKRLQALPDLNSVSTQLTAKTPQLYVDIDRTKSASHGVALADVNQTLDMYLGSLYVNSYNSFGRHWQVTVQAESAFRSRTENIGQLQVRNSSGQMVPLATLIQVREIGGPIAVTRYNLYTAAPMNGNLQPGGSTGDAIAAIDRVANQTLPLSMKTEWTELMFLQIRAGNTALYVFALAVISVFLALAALYESWPLPLAVILVVPLCLLCSVAGVLLTHRDVNIFVQIGLVVLVGLACKNAILIVEFAKQLTQQDRPRFEATQEASRLRLRPILMTSFAFIFGVVPLVVARGAGAEMRQSLGTAVFSGMLGVTLFGIFLTPVFFYVIQGLGETPLFRRAAFRRLGSCTLGGLLGLASGFALAQIGVGHLPWAPLIGAFAGIVIVLAALEVHRRSSTSPTRSQG